MGFDGSIYIIENALGNDRSKMKARLFAKGLYEVMGLEYVDGKLYALQKWELTELNDTDGDGVADDYRVALGNWTASSNFHEWAFGLIYRNGLFLFQYGHWTGREWYHYGYWYTLYSHSPDKRPRKDA
jgi:hypothetical protein